MSDSKSAAIPSEPDKEGVIVSKRDDVARELRKADWKGEAIDTLFRPDDGYLRMADAVLAREQKLREQVERLEKYQERLSVMHSRCLSAVEVKEFRALVARLAGTLTEDHRKLRGRPVAEGCPTCALLADPIVRECLEEKR